MIWLLVNLDSFHRRTSLLVEILLRRSPLLWGDYPQRSYLITPLGKALAFNAHSQKNSMSTTSPKPATLRPNLSSSIAGIQAFRMLYAAYRVRHRDNHPTERAPKSPTGRRALSAAAYPTDQTAINRIGNHHAGGEHQAREKRGNNATVTTCDVAPGRRLGGGIKNTRKQNANEHCRCRAPCHQGFVNLTLP